ncbi:NAD(P)/FAD-dependent oxidoreductase [Traorella massiliensis]|uniref:NAD(P)/FAD-dependent oxidoreductase n=1 Tax=Traorella massiliensis TaxID=1903263 RepID=UPI002353F19D|nr:hypothetical protein [Traorella massiliensis]
MLRVNECRLLPGSEISQLRKVIAKKLKTKDTFEYEIVRESIDARKEEIYLTYSVDVQIAHEEKYLHLKDVTLSKTKKTEKIHYTSFETRPLIIGMGPSGLFCALYLAMHHAAPILYERGSCVEKRMKDVEAFFQGGPLNESSNVQFGEGGAGTFSDGKLTSRSKDPKGRYVLEQFVRFGADPAIVYQSHPHIGTDELVKIIKKMREEIIRLGGEIHFDHTLEDMYIENDQIRQVQINGQWLPCDDLFLGIGHSARDTFRMLNERKVHCIAKNFAVGVRIEHLQKFVDESQYGSYTSLLGPASYRLTHTTQKGRGVYTFCMCPGGEVVMATSTFNHVVTNGMSYHKRDSVNANSALLVQVTTDDVGHGLFDGMNFQEELEKKAFELGGKNYHAPAQRVGDFLKHQPTTAFGSIQPSCRTGVTPCDLHELFPAFINESLEEGILAMDKKMKGFAQEDAVMCGVESRSTSPIRIERTKDCVSVNVKNLYPMGEGAGYAGGIVSAAIDGIRCAEEWMKKRGKL